MSKPFGFGTWAHRVYDFGDSPDAVDTSVERLTDAGFSLIVVSVKNPPGYADFQTDVAHVNPAYPDWDPLKVLAESADRHGAKVHAWMCVFPEGANSALLEKTPQLAAVLEGERRIRWACACHPEVQAYELALYRSVAERYPVHGLHLDYIRTGEHCRCEYCKAQMAARGLDITTLAGKDPAYGEWVNWRCDRVTAFVEQMRALTREKGIELSAAVSAQIISWLFSNAQDWARWVEKGLLDFLFPMDYDNFARRVDLKIRQNLALVDGRCAVWDGLGKKSSNSELTTEALVEQVQTLKRAGAQGVVIFNYKALTDADLAAIGRMG
ncbi:MAG: family 10 glycosylhydrolase [Kiritimatiellae bacterium]|nr:family 10 glycosylhydrolase [Kiritimatiellia bacterium]